MKEAASVSVEPVVVNTTRQADGSYPVVVRPGAQDLLPQILRDHAPAARYAIVADAMVADLLGPSLRAGLEEAGLKAELVRFPAGEQHKTRESWIALTDALIGRGVGRDGCIIALGGGVTGDLAGFVAATYMRGIPYVQVPTTLLAMVDAAVGGKTAVDTPAGKNLVGAFHQPRAVLIDPRVLQTLPDEHLRSGLAEGVKHGAIADAGYLEWIGEAAKSFLDLEEEPLTRLIRRSVEIKADVVSRDPLEAGPRQALNFGHTLAHALETASGYRAVHGFAVGAGMIASAEVGEELGITREGSADTLREVLGALGIPLHPAPGVPPARLLDLAGRDKKNRGDRTRYTMIEHIGKVATTPEGEYTFALEDEAVTSVLTRLWG